MYIHIVNLTLLLLFVFNVAFGNAVMNVLIGFVPLNELLIIALFISTVFVKKCKLNIVSAPLLIWTLGSLILYLPFGIYNNGIWAGRDATNQIDSLIYFVVLFLYSSARMEILQEKFASILLAALIVESFDRVLFGPLFSGLIYIESFQNVSLFGGTIGSSVIIFAALWFGVYYYRDYKHTSGLLIVLSLSLIILHQNRFLYISAITTLFIYTLLVDRTLFVKALITIPVVIAVVSSTLALVSDEMLSSGRLVKYASSDISLYSIYEHLLTSFGYKSEVYTGSSDGAGHRLSWWLNIFEELTSDPFTLFFSGLGFGVPLVGEWAISVLREPHNSFISVMSRSGLIMFSIWGFFLSTSIAQHATSMLRYRGDKYIRKSPQYKIISVSFFVQISVLITALVEPAFELPPIAISFYIISAFGLICIGQVKLMSRSPILR